MKNASVFRVSALFLVLCLLGKGISGDGGTNEVAISTENTDCEENLQRPLHISIETWRWLPHSYAIIGMNMALTLRKMQLRGDANIRVSFVDAAPLYNEVIDWRSKKDYGLFSEENSRLLSAIPQTHSLPYADSTIPDVVFKIAYPFNTSIGVNYSHPQIIERPLIFTYGTVEKKHCPPDMLTNDSPPWPDVQVRMITPSAWSAAGLEACGVPSEKIDVVPNGYDPDVFYAPSTFERRNARAHFGFSEHDVVFFAIGAMTSNKGITNVIRSFVKAFQLHPERAKLVLKGLPMLYPSPSARVEIGLADLFEHLPGIQNAIHFLTESLPFQGLRRLFHAVDVLLTPYTAEGFNMPALEAVASGLTVVATAGGPTDAFTRSSFTLWVESEMVIDAQSGKQFFEPSPKSLLGHMQWLMTREGAEFRLAARTAGPSWLLSQSSPGRHNCTNGWTQCRDRDLFHEGYSWESVARTFVRLAQKNSRSQAPSRKESVQITGAQVRPAHVEVQELKKELQTLSAKVVALERENSELRSQLSHHGESLDAQGASAAVAQEQTVAESVPPQRVGISEGEQGDGVEAFDFFL